MKPESFRDLLDRWGRARPPKTLRREGEDFEAWQKRFRAALDALRGPLPERVPPEPEIVESTDCGGHARHLVRMKVSEVSTLVAWLLVPAGIKPGEKRPGMLVTHGHHPQGMDAMAGANGAEVRSYVTGMLEAGYVLLAPAWWGWAGRDGHLDLVGESRDKCNVIQMAAAMYGLNVLDLHVQDGRAALDILAARPEVDAGRLGVIGNSYGGRTAMWLAVFDERLRVCVSAGAMNTFRERSLKLGSCAIQYPPGLLEHGDVPELYSLIAPRALELQAGEGDGLITPADRDAIAAAVERSYRDAGAADKFKYVLHGEGHELLWPPAAPFLAKHL